MALEIIWCVTPDLHCPYSWEAGWVPEQCQMK